ncbi:MAG: hypothetical protein Q8Q38_02280 [bacterium]|nr:hypothetical protein [bacterium]
MAKEMKVVDVRAPGARDARPAERAPEKAQRKTPRQPMSFRFPLWAYALGLLLIAGVASMGVINVFFASAYAVIHPQVRQLSTEVQISTSAGIDKVSLENLSIPSRLFIKEVQATRLFLATGSTVGEDRAKGVIRVFNERTSPQTLVANTRFLSENGKLFRSSGRVVVPSASTKDGNVVPGTLDVNVEAAEAGPEYNIGASSFSLPGLAGSSLYTLVYGRSFDPMSEGFKGETQVVKDTDILKAKEQLIAQLVDQAKSKIAEDLPPFFLLPENAYVSEIVKAESQAIAGTPVSEFNYAATVRLSALAYDSGDMEEIALSLLNLQVGDEERLNENKVSAEASLEDASLLRVSLKGEVYKNLNTSSIASQLLGKTEREAATSLGSSNPGITEMSISFWPFWVQRVPKDPNRVQVTLRLD